MRLPNYANGRCAERRGLGAALRDPVLYMALELSNKTWMLALSDGPAQGS